MKEKIQLSPSKLNDFVRCPRCFHDQYVSKVVKPRGIFPTLPGGMDLILKKYVDSFRGSIPHGLAGQLPGVLLRDEIQMKKWRHWRTGPTYFDKENNIELIGALDDCLDDKYVHIPLDWKSKGSEPMEDGSKYYQLQMDCYNLMLDAQGLQTRNEAYLVYFYPREGRSNSQNGRVSLGIIEVLFGLKVFQLKCSKENARLKMIEAADCLRGPRPKSHSECEHCQYLILEHDLSHPIVMNLNTNKQGKPQ